MIPLELFFLLNAALDALMLYLALLWLEIGRIRLGRVFAAACIGAAYACLAYHPRLTPLQALPFRGLCAAVMARIAAGSMPLGQILRATGFIVAAAFLSGGAATAILLAVPGLNVPMALLVGAVASGLVGHAWLRRSRKAVMPCGTVTLRHRQAQLSFEAAVDTGNQALDALTGLPVIVLPRERAEAAFPALRRDELPEGMRLIALRSVSGTALLPCFQPDILLWNQQPVKAIVAIAPKGTLRMALAPPIWDAARAGRRLA